MKRRRHSFKGFVAFSRRDELSRGQKAGTRRYPPAPDRDPIGHEDEEQFVSELCIRIFEKFMDWCGEDDELSRSRYLDIFSAYSDILQDELKKYAFELAYELYAEDPIVKKRRRELSRRRGD